MIASLFISIFIAIASVAGFIKALLIFGLVAAITAFIVLAVYLTIDH